MFSIGKAVVFAILLVLIATCVPMYSGALVGSLTPSQQQYANIGMSGFIAYLLYHGGKYLIMGK